MQFLLLHVFFIICFCNYLNHGATFENLTAILHENFESWDGKSSTRVLHVKEFSIESDDSLLAYVGDENIRTNLLIDQQKLSKLPEGAFKDLIKITGVRIRRSHLQEIEPGAFRNVPKLEKVDLSENELEIIKNGVFSGLAITDLYLIQNNIHTIEDQAFNNMKLKRLYLQDNQISLWNVEWVRGSPITFLAIDQNLLKEISPNSFSIFEKPVVLFLQKNSITTIHPGAFAGTGKLMGLFLAKNQITELQPGVFDGVTEINTITLSNNNITGINKEVFGNTKVTDILDLNNNFLTEFPLDLLKTRQLGLVSLNGNPLKCSFFVESENWLQNKTGEYQRELYDQPFDYAYDDYKKNCT